MSRPLPVVLLWHLHQPLYKDPAAGRCLLPWARLHGVNAYTTMAILADEFAELPLTFNLVPCLLLQIQEYATGAVSDPWLEAALRPADELEQDQRCFLLRWFFLGRPEAMILPHPRYRELWQLRGSDIREEALVRAALGWTSAQLRDLQVWFHLAWTSPLLRERDPALRALVQKGSGYTEEEKSALLAIHRTALGALAGRYRRLQETGAAEISTSPFYHPILPLLCDLAAAREADPSVSLPAEPFAHPEDARTQIERAIAFHSRCFGQRPLGLWPSEGSVSEPVLRLVSEAGIQWIATDDGILHRSLARSNLPPPTYHQVAVWRECADLAIFFRHHELSDRIGFRYAALSPEAAVADLVGALRRIHETIPADGSGAVLTIALDGENPWESYPGQGVPFLRSLYTALLTDPVLAPVTPARFLQENPSRRTLERLVPGSWIDGTFRICAGHPEDHRAWELLARARHALVQAQAQPDGPSPEAIQAAWEALYAAEGSDWTWWYGEEHTSGTDELFDRLFRGYLQAIYRSLNLQVPDEVLPSISQNERDFSDYVEQSALVRPTVDGRITHFFEWQGAGIVTPKGGALGLGPGPIRRLLCGFDTGGLWLRLDPHPSRWPLVGAELSIEVTIGPRRLTWAVRLDEGLHHHEAGAFQIDAGVQAIVELRIAGEILLGDEAKTLALRVTVNQRGTKLQSIPEVGTLRITRWSGTAAETA